MCALIMVARQEGKYEVIRNLKAVIRDSPLVDGKCVRLPRPNDGLASSRTRGRPPLAPFLSTGGMVMVLYGHYPVFYLMLRAR